MIELNRIYNEDCLETMKRMEDKSVDLVLTDPPYGIKATKMTLGSGQHNFHRGDWDNATPSKKMFDEIFRVSKNQVIWGGNYFSDILEPTNNWFIWDKLNPNLSFSEAEMAWTSARVNTRIYKCYSASKQKIHPTQKPDDLFQWILAKYLIDDMTVYDPFIGSGTTAIACIKENRQWIGSEISKEYCDIANKRIQNELNQLKLF